jgi:hypothetical protein
MTTRFLLFIVSLMKVSVYLKNIAYSSYVSRNPDGPNFVFDSTSIALQEITASQQQLQQQYRN